MIDFFLFEKIGSKIYPTFLSNYKYDSPQNINSDYNYATIICIAEVIEDILRKAFPYRPAKTTNTLSLLSKNKSDSKLCIDASTDLSLGLVL